MKYFGKQTVLQVTIILTECIRSRLASLKFSFSLILAGTIVAL